MQQLPDKEKIGKKKEISILKRTVYDGGRKVYAFYQKDTEELNFVVYR